MKMKKEKRSERNVAWKQKKRVNRSRQPIWGQKLNQLTAVNRTRRLAFPFAGKWMSLLFVEI
jgi:hypothetical protein